MMEYEVRRLLKTGAVDSALLLADLTFHGKHANLQEGNNIEKCFTNCQFDPLQIGEMLYSKGEYMYCIDYLNIAASELSAWTGGNVSSSIRCPWCSIDMFIPPNGLAVEALCPQCHGIDEQHKVGRVARIASLRLQCFIGCKDLDAVVGVQVECGCMTTDFQYDEPTLAQQPVVVQRQQVQYLECAQKNQKHRDQICACLGIIILANPLDVLAVQRQAEHRGDVQKVCNGQQKGDTRPIGAVVSTLHQAFQLAEVSESLQGITQQQGLRQKYPQSAYQRAQTTFYAFQCQDADDFFRDLIQNQSSRFVTDMDRVGFYQFKHSRYNELIKLCKEAMRGAPNRQETKVLQAQVAYTADQSQACEQLLDACQQVNPRHVTALLVRAWCYVQKGAFTQAITLYKGMRQQQGVGVDFSIEVGQCNSYQLNKDKTEAFQIAANTLTKAPRNPKAYAVIGAVLAAAQNDQNATLKSEKAFIKALTLDPTCTEAALHLSKLHFRAGNLQTALDVMLNVARLNANEMVHTQLGYVYTAKKEPVLAAKHFQLALERYPQYPAALAGLEELSSNITASQANDNQHEQSI